MDAALHPLLRLKNNPAAVSVNSPLSQSPLAGVWHGYPRFGLPRDTALTARYFGGAALAAAPWLAVAAVCLLLACCSAACCGPLSRTRRRARARPAGSSSSASSAKSRSGAAGLAAGVFLFNAAFWLVGVGFVATYSFYSGVRDVFGALAYGIDGIFGAAVNMAEFTEVLLDRVTSFGAIADSFEEILNDVDTLRAQAKQFVREARALLDSSNGILGAVRGAGLGVYALLIVLFIALLAGLLLVFVASGRRRKQRSASCVMCLMIFPLVLSWVAVGVVTTAGVLLGDACFMIGDYHRLILDQAIGSENYAGGINPADNVIYDLGVTCPTDYVSPDVLDSLRVLIVDKTDADFTDNIITILFPGEDATGFSAYASKLFTGLSDCSSVVRFAGRLHQATCQSSGPLLGLFVIWIALMLLALVLTASFFTAQYSSYDPTRFHTPLALTAKRSNPSHTGLTLSDPESGDVLPEEVPVFDDEEAAHAAAVDVAHSATPVASAPGSPGRMAGRAARGVTFEQS